MIEKAGKGFKVGIITILNELKQSNLTIRKRQEVSGEK